ncbi:helix-turn-helix domain containing protein [Enterococcus innesii]|uniref:helix-turn-helix domain containing protein n=1 Tax=Enterococcus innesii TaxID=2839759 RepID=UPI0022B98842|nr:helix-turn-helix domain containing protein [Enterococcus innesii]
MSHLFYHLIHHEKTKRWLMSLERLENTPAMTGKTLATALDCTVRTIQTDIKQIKDYFGSSILLLGDEEGYHLSFQSPVVYTKKKKALLEAEPLFVYADQLLAGTHRTNQEWASYFSVSLASFGRIKRLFVQLLKQEYQLTIRGMDNRLYGKEAAIRQFMYDLYFTLPLSPRSLEERLASLPTVTQTKQSTEWLVDPVRLDQWSRLAQWRIAQGKLLPTNEGQKSMCDQLVAAFGETHALEFPPQEKAALFLLALQEEQFLNPLKQKAFFHQFSSVPSHRFPLMDFEQVTVYFFETWITLMRTFFQLVPEKTTNEQTDGMSEAQQCFHQLMQEYEAHKTRIKRSLLVLFDVSGNYVLQEWIKKSVRLQLQKKGYYLIEGGPPPSYARPLIVTNYDRQRDTTHALILPRIPDEEDIKQALQAGDW